MCDIYSMEQLYLGNKIACHQLQKEQGWLDNAVMDASV